MTVCSDCGKVLTSYRVVEQNGDFKNEFCSTKCLVNYYNGEIMAQKMSPSSTEAFIICDYCGKEEPIPYGEAVNNEVPQGWVRASDDKHHFCCVDHWQDYIPMRQIHAGSGSIPTARVIPTTDTEQIDVNAQGGKQSHVDEAFHRLDPDAILELIEVLGYGDKKYNEPNAKIGDENWRKLDHLDHINHAGIHLMKHMRELKSGPRANDPEAGQHLSHALCRLMFALASKPQ